VPVARTGGRGGYSRRGLLAQATTVDLAGYITLKEAAARFRISQSHLQLLARKGRLRAIKHGRDWFTTTEAVAAYLADTELRRNDPYKYKRD
jgi:excisionase family DNA binding protein